MEEKKGASPRLTLSIENASPAPGEPETLREGADRCVVVVFREKEAEGDPSRVEVEVRLWQPPSSASGADLVHAALLIGQVLAASPSPGHKLLGECIAQSILEGMDHVAAQWSSSKTGQA